MEAVFPSPDARWRRQGRTSPGQVRAGAPAEAAVGSQQLLAGVSRGCAGDLPRGAGSGRRALRPDTAHPASRLLSSASPRDATGAKAGGCPRPGRSRTHHGPRRRGGSCRPRTCPVPMSDAPSRSRPLPGSLSVSMRPVRAGAAGTLRWAPGHGSSGCYGGDRARDGGGQGRHTEPLVTCGPGQESLRTQVNPQPQQHKMADTSPRTSRDPARRQL